MQAEQAAGCENLSRHQQCLTIGRNIQGCLFTGNFLQDDTNKTFVIRWQKAEAPCRNLSSLYDQLVNEDSPTLLSKENEGVGGGHVRTLVRRDRQGELLQQRRSRPKPQSSQGRGQVR